MGSRWTDFKKRWKDCEECSLCETRTKIVLTRGTLPCEVLFIGEAPGKGENVVGKPFVGPAGGLLDKIIEEALENRTWKGEFKIAFTNLICCVPLGDDGEKINEPPEESIQACSERLADFVYNVARPEVIVSVGKLAAKHVPNILEEEIGELEIDLFDIVHPAFILRSDPARQGLMIQRSIVTVEEAFTKVIPF